MSTLNFEQTQKVMIQVKVIVVLMNIIIIININILCLIYKTMVYLMIHFYNNISL